MVVSALGRFLYRLPSGSYEVKRTIGGKDFYKTFKSNELDKAKKYRDNLEKRTQRLEKESKKLIGKKAKETKLKKYGTVAAGLEKRNVTVNENIGVINFKNKADEARFETAVTLFATLPQGASGRATKEIDDLFMKSFPFFTSKSQMQKGRRAMMKKLGLKKPLAPKASTVLSDSQTKKMSELKQLARNTKVELDASHVANEGTQKSIYKIGLGDVPEKTTGLGGQTYFTSPSTTKATTQRLKPTFLTTSEKNEFFHKQMEDELTLLLDNRNKLLAELDEISDLKPTRKVSLFKLLKQNQNQLDAIDENMKALRIFTTLKDPITGKIKNFGQLPESVTKTVALKKGIQGTTTDAILGVKDGGRVKKSIGGLTKDKQKGFRIEGLGTNKVGTLESMLAGVGAGLIDIPKGAFTLGAALLDLGFGTSNAAKVERYFDNLTNLDEKAEATFAGDLTRIMVNLGVPGGFAFKKGAELATKAMLAKKHGNYFRLTDPRLEEKFKTSLNAKGRLFATLGGAGAAGVSDMIFVGDPEHVGTIGDMFGGPTQLRENDENSAAREVANRIKFGVDSSLLIGAVGGTGSAIKSLVRRSNDLQSNNDAIDKFFAYLRPRGKKTQEFFDIERANLGLRRSDINRAEEISRKLDRHIDAIFPFVKNPFNQMGNKGRREFMSKLNDTLLSGDYNISGVTGKTSFGAMDKNKVKEITKIMRDKGGKAEDIQGVIDSFYDIRAGWQLMFDDLGTAMGKDALSEFAPLFGKKFKDYLGSTYEIFRNKSVIPLLNYKPSEQAVKKMMQLFKESASESGVKLSDEQAEYYVNELIKTATPPKAISTSAERTSGVYFNAPDFFVNKTTLADLEMPPKTLPLESLTDDARRAVEEVLGKVEDPLQTILTGTNKLSLVTRRNQLFQTLKRNNDEILERRNKFIRENPGAEIPAGLRGMFRETELEAINDLGKNIKQIKLDPSRTEEAGIVNPLDGLYAERGVAEAIEQSAMIAKDKSNLFQLYQSFILYPKATSQLAKTVLSPITHARNFISAGAFAAANGIIPGLTVSFDDTGRAFREAYGALQVPGARIDNTRYRELLRLGVVNTNVRLGDLQKLLKDVNFGEKFDSNVALRNMMRPMSKLKKWTEDMYTAEDDFWKITTFAIERSRLEDTYKKFGMKYSKELLDEEAAKIVKNNVPNYDYVNDFVKDLRQLPFGNFVSFPAEIYRTGYNILNQAWKEIFTTHTLADGRVVTPFRDIGMKRLFGMATTTLGVPYGTVEAFKAIHDVTEEEMSALRRFVPEWSKNSTLVPIRGEDGKLKYVDFSHANAYDTLIRPINTLFNGVQKGLEEEEVFKNTFLAMIDATKETASPFVSESIWTEGLMDVAPILGRGGRTAEGRRLWTDETPWGEAFYAGIKHLGATVVPGSGPAFIRMGQALTETVDEYGRSYEFGDELLGVAGMRVVEVDPARSMKFKIADFRTGINNSRREFTGPLLKGGPITPEQVVDRFQVANQSLFRVQQRMFKDYYAARTLGVSDRALENTFEDRVSNKQVRAIQNGRFTPFIPSENIAQAFADNAREIGQPDAFARSLDQIKRIIRRYQRLRLGDDFPIIDNPFRATISERAIGPISQLGGTPLDNTALAQPLIGGQQVATAQRGQQVFGSTDPIFGTG
jgi:hypothetical protein